VAYAWNGFFPVPPAKQIMPEPTYLIEAELSPHLSPPERRCAERYFCSRLPVIRLLTRPALQSLSAVVENISVGGVRLLVDLPVPPGTIIALGLLCTRPSLIQSARVVHATPAGEGKWAIGCKLSTPLSKSELACLVE
jgi:hypothetical protein